jgi:hypothetical protein
MQIEELGRSSATVTLTADELRAVNNALNEVCNGVGELDNDDEFATRLGVTRQEARELLGNLHELFDRVRTLSD